MKVKASPLGLQRLARNSLSFYKITWLQSICESKSRSVVSDSLWPHGLYSPWNSPGQNAGVGSLSLLQRIFPPRDQTQVSLIAGKLFTSWATREAPYKAKAKVNALFKRQAFHIRWLKYWSFSNGTSDEYLGLISSRIDWFDFLAVQGPLKSLLNTW